MPVGYVADALARRAGHAVGDEHHRLEIGAAPAEPLNALQPPCVGAELRNHAGHAVAERGFGYERAQLGGGSRVGIDFDGDADAFGPRPLDALEDGGDLAPVGPFGSLEMAHQHRQPRHTPDLDGFVDGGFEVLPLVADVADVDAAVTRRNLRQIDDFAGFGEAAGGIDQARREP